MGKHIFGPVPSRRLGLSLGVDIIPLKTCSYDCVYCQLGHTIAKTWKRQEYISTDEVVDELEQVLTETHPDYITFSGSGEPTLNSAIGKIITEIKAITDIPVAVLTNGSLLYMQAVRDSLQGTDLVVPSLDAATQTVYEKINRPPTSVKVENIIDGLRQFSAAFKGAIWLEIMLVDNTNTDESEISKLVDITNALDVDKIQLNTVVRPPAEEFAYPVSRDKMQEFKARFGERAEVIADFSKITQKAYRKDTEEQILTLLRRRPCTIADISESMGIHQNEVIKYITEMTKQKLVNSTTYDARQYYGIAG